MGRLRRLLIGLASMLLASANCAHSCGGSKSDFVSHDPCTGNVQEGASCVGVAGTICEQKVHPNPACNAWEVCTAERKWAKRPAEKGDCPSTCPASYVETPAVVAEENGALCEYPEGTCGPAHAHDGGDASPNTWQCVKTKARRGTVEQCPAVRPAIGSAGCPDGLVCDYGECELRGGVALRCEENSWVLMGAQFLAGGTVQRGPCH